MQCKRNGYNFISLNKWLNFKERLQLRSNQMGWRISNCLFHRRPRVLQFRWKFAGKACKIKIFLHLSLNWQQERFGTFAVSFSLIALILGLIVFFLHSAVARSEAQDLCVKYNCQALETSAAESYTGIRSAFKVLLKEARSANLQRCLPIRRKLGVNTVGVNFSKVVNYSICDIYLRNFFLGAWKYFRQEQ